VTSSTIFHRVGSPPSDFRPYIYIWVPNGVECEAARRAWPRSGPSPRCAQDTSPKTDCWSLGLHKVFLKLL
jgi:hypothetical protein